MKDKTEVVKTKTTTVGMPTAFAEYAGVGAENITQQDIKLPHLKIIEGGSPYVKSNSDDYIEEAKIGDLVNSATKELYTNKTGGALLIPIITKKLYTEWADRNSADSPGRPISYRETPEGANEIEITNDRGIKKKILRLPNGNDLSETQYFYGLILDSDNDVTPIMISMSSTRLASARDMLTCIFNYTQKGLPTFAAILNIKTATKSKNADSWNIFTINRLKEHDLLKDGFLDVDNNDKALKLFNLAISQHKLVTENKDFFINTVEKDSEQEKPKQGSGTSSKAAKEIL